MTLLCWRHTRELMFIFSRTLCRGDIYTNREVLKKSPLLHSPLHPSWILMPHKTDAKRRYCSCPLVQWTSQFRAYFWNTYQVLCNVLRTVEVRAHLRPSGWWREGLCNNGRQCMGVENQDLNSVMPKRSIWPGWAFTLEKGSKRLQPDDALRQPCLGWVSTSCMLWECMVC